MLSAAERRLAYRIAAGTVALMLGHAAEVFRVLRPGGRFVIADPQPPRTQSYLAARPRR